MHSDLHDKTVQFLRDYPLPGTEHSLLDSGRVSHWSEDEQKLSLALELDFPAVDITGELTEKLQKELLQLFPQRGIELEIGWKAPRCKVQGKLRSLPEIANIIAVSSAKGGVGKSTVAVNLALALKQLGARVGILDADIYGPSQQIMLGIDPGQRPQTKPPNSIVPLEVYDIQTMSMGYLLSDKQPLVWRGPMVSGALQQMLSQTLWRELDYLVVDMPPGTGDIQLTLAQKVPVSGAVLVTSPQDVAVADTRRCAGMFKKVEISVLGVVENMGAMQCPECGTRVPLFGSDGGQGLATELKVPLLGAIPLNPAISVSSDRGTPVVEKEPNSSIAEDFRNLARNTAMALARQSREDTNKLNIVDITDAMSNKAGAGNNK